MLHKVYTLRIGLLLAAATWGLTLCAQPADDMAALRLQWREMLTGGTLDQTSPLVKSYAADVNTKASKIWEALIKKPASGEDNRSCLFADFPITSRTNIGSSQISMTYDRLRSLTLAYKIQGTDFYQRPEVFSELKAALDMMLEKHYSLAQTTSGRGTAANGGAYGNWYDWRIGTPLRYGDLLVMLSDELTPEQIASYVAPILSNNTVVDNTGANRTWIAGIVAQAGALKGDAALLTKAKDGLKSIFPYVTAGDGYYADGSFVQHGNYAYTGGYGKALLVTIAQLMHVLNGSPWAIAYADGIEHNFYDMLFAAYEPLLYGGRFMDMVREREISRVANQDHIPGRQALRAFALLLDVLPAAQKARAEVMLKEALQDSVVLRQLCSDPIDGGFLEYYLTPGVMATALALLRDSSIAPRGPLVAHKTFAAIDRVVHRRPHFAYGIAMTSPRIKNTEGTNDEGLRLWHIGDGMTYLYTDDRDEWAEHFWATVDHQRLPGTTVTRAARSSKDSYGTHNPNAWVGGADLGEYGAAGMMLTGLGASATRRLNARKSWFMFDNEVVALGSDVRLTEGSAPVETVVDNRRLKADKSNAILVNGVEQRLTAEGDHANGEHRNVSWLFVEQNIGLVPHRQPPTGVGYYFPHPTRLQGLRETRTGRWSDVNPYAKYSDTTLRQNAFATFWISHGSAPANQQYAYVLLPDVTPEQTDTYSRHPDIEILQQDSIAHAVREKTLGLTAINFWSAGRVDAYTVDRPACVLAKQNGDGSLELALSDPTRSSEAVRLRLDPALLPVAEAIEMAEGVSLASGGVLTFATQGKLGGSLRVRLRLDLKKGEEGK
ncbi:MAG: polysaccharide lyase 8 family protein [Prevotellaceae bacterium]|jgi:hypothetical protein|nr:polysaccharide lyase 8 family protein [Prevotellaceae bacterium]